MIPPLPSPEQYAEALKRYNRRRNANWTFPVLKRFARKRPFGWAVMLAVVRGEK